MIYIQKFQVGKGNSTLDLEIIILKCMSFLSSFSVTLNSVRLPEEVPHFPLYYHWSWLETIICSDLQLGSEAPLCAKHSKIPRLCVLLIYILHCPNFGSRLLS